MTHIHIDMDQVEKNIAAGEETMRPTLNAPGLEGAFARLTVTMGSAWSRQFATEINRGTGPDDLRHALANVIANAIFDLSGSLNDLNNVSALARDQFETLQIVVQALNKASNHPDRVAFTAVVDPSITGRA